MCLSRRVARDRLEPADVRVYQLDERQAESLSHRELENSPCAAGVELESLDWVECAPYLLLLTAQEKAQAIIDEARGEAEALRARAVMEGAAEGREEAKQKSLPSLAAFANAGQALIVFEEQMIGRYAPELVRLALEIAEKIVHGKVAADPEIVASVLDRARQEVVEAQRIRIRLNPKDHELLVEVRPDLLALGNEKGRTIEVVEDSEVDCGGCRLETEIGIVDATVPTQFLEVRRQLVDEEKTPTTTAFALAGRDGKHKAG